MSCFSNEIVEIFRKWNRQKLCTDLEDIHKGLMERRTEWVEYGDRRQMTPQRLARLNCEVLRQVLLHRAERLLVSAGTMLLEKNVYGLALITRGHTEGTAVLGYFCNWIRLLAAATDIDFTKAATEIADAIMGAKHELFGEANDPKNILTCIEKADRFLDSEVFEGEKHMSLRDCYDWLSEFAHPNFLSNSSALTLDKETGRIVFRHDGELIARDLDIIGYLWISAELFLECFDRFGVQPEAAFGS
jgi:hypothetical protein